MDRILLRQVCVLGSLHQPGQVIVRLQAVLNRRLDQAEHDRTAGSSFRGVGKQEILSVNDEGLNASLRPVIGDLQPAVLQIIGQVRSPVLQVGQSRAQSGLRRSGCRSAAAYAAVVHIPSHDFSYEA